ncbi:MAG: phage tail terminator-like protein [Flavobacteriaceae bacterium]
MASIYDDIRAALEVKLSTVAGVPSIGWENAQFSPTTGQPYVKPRLMPTRREPAVRGTNPQMYYQGIFRIECYVPEGAGPSAGDDLADKIINAFEATTDVSQGSTIVSIRYAEREMAEIDGPFYMIPVNIGWYIYK